MEHEPKNPNKFSPDSALAYARDGRIEEWVHDFLLAQGNNPALSEGLKKQKRYWYGPAEITLNKLQRTAGPEPEMPYRSQSEESWKQKIGGIKDHFQKGGSLPPLIAEYNDGQLVLRDGNHRQGALSQHGEDSYWTIVWFNSEEDEEEFKKAHEA